MKEFRLELNGMACESCEKLVGKVAEQNSVSIRDIDIKNGTVTAVCEEGAIGQFKIQLAERGFTERSSGPRGDPSRVISYVSSVVSGEIEVESRLLNFAIASTAAMIVVGAAIYIFSSKGLAKPTAYLPLVFLSVFSSIATVFSYYHMSCYRKSLTCMNGMMVGMTMGMVSGFLFGAIAGATNGMFIGSTAGMVVGMAIGGNIGRSCGIMGAMEGIMAGLMAGVMGAMTSVMMISDNLITFLYLLFGVCALMLGGLSYMMYREAGVAPKIDINPRFASFLLTSAALSVLFILIMFYGPKGPITYP